ncbi:MAG: endonuclease III [Alphaproteobacteria bacterium]|nr:endonuclease III [Alphaproteobacteria bacterium]
MNAAQRDEFFRRLHQQNPHPETELRYHNHYTLLVAVILSAQATDKGVNKATEKLFETVDNPQAMVALGLDNLITHIKTIGLYQNKAKNVIAMSQQLLDDHQGKVPQTREALEALAGVGRKTANVVLNVAFGQKTMAVDTHIFRLSNITGLAKGKNVLAVEHALLKNIPEQWMQHAHHWLILHGRYVCKARKPLCEQCIVSDLCDGFRTQN